MMTKTQPYTVRVTRPDGSVTFRGSSMTTKAAERERDAWRDAGYGAELVDMTTAAPELKEWREATKGGGRYFPV